MLFTLLFQIMTGRLRDTKSYQDEFSWKAVVFTPVQVLKGMLPFTCSELHQAAEGTILHPDKYL